MLQQEPSKQSGIGFQTELSWLFLYIQSPKMVPPKPLQVQEKQSWGTDNWVRNYQMLNKAEFLDCDAEIK